MIEIRTQKLRRGGLAIFCPVKPTEKGKEEKGSREEERIERGEEKKKIVTKGKSKAKRSEFLAIFQFLVIAPSCP